MLWILLYSIKLIFSNYTPYFSNAHAAFQSHQCFTHFYMQAKKKNENEANICIVIFANVNIMNSDLFFCTFVNS